MTTCPGALSLPICPLQRWQESPSFSTVLLERLVAPTHTHSHPHTPTHAHSNQWLIADTALHQANRANRARQGAKSVSEKPNLIPLPRLEDNCRRDSQERRSAREKPTAAAARSQYVYLGKLNQNNLQPGIAPEDWGHHRCGAFHPNNGKSALT
ncbi:hypothetical protein Q8A73_009026 [Channa argus]|nr:hypothetical protein Q8A73_009026 [Channa argus]